MADSNGPQIDGLSEWTLVELSLIGRKYGEKAQELSASVVSDFDELGTAIASRFVNCHRMVRGEDLVEDDA